MAVLKLSKRGKEGSEIIQNSLTCCQGSRKAVRFGSADLGCQKQGQLYPE